MDIKGIDKAKILVALFSMASPRGLGWLQHKPSDQLTLDDARALLKDRTYFDYLRGRVMKVNLAPNVNELDLRLFERDNGPAEARLMELLTAPSAVKP